MDTKEGQRDKIIDLLSRNPGLHFRAIQRETEMAVGQLEYHLYQLEKNGKISSKRDGRFKRYFVSENVSALENKIAYHLRNKKSRDIIFRLLRSSCEDPEQLRRKVKLHQDDFDLTVKVLVDEIILKWDNEEICIVSPDLIRNAIKKIKTSFLNELAESLIDLLDSE